MRPSPPEARPPNLGAPAPFVAGGAGRGGQQDVVAGLGRCGWAILLRQPGPPTTPRSGTGSAPVPEPSAPPIERPESGEINSSSDLPRKVQETPNLGSGRERCSHTVHMYRRRTGSRKQLLTPAGHQIELEPGGEGGIRTHDGVAPITVFETAGPLLNSEPAQKGRKHNGSKTVVAHHMRRSDTTSCRALA
jgi:hypothetical protein